MTFSYAILYLSVLLASAGQVMLKFGAKAGGFDLGIVRMNRWIVFGLGIMVICMFLSVKGLKVVPLRDMAFILPTIYIAVPIFSRILLKENLSCRTLIGTFIIALGVIIFNIPSIRLF